MPLALPLSHSPGRCSPAVVFSQATKAAEEVFVPKKAAHTHTTPRVTEPSPWGMSVSCGKEITARAWL